MHLKSDIGGIVSVRKYVREVRGKIEVIYIPGKYYG